MESFVEFCDKKEREAKKHLKIIKKLLESGYMKVTSHIDDDDPYIFLFTPGKMLTFDGIRIYSIGNQLAFRIQKEEKTHPFGKAYPMDIEEMFNDLLSDYHKPEAAGKKVIEAVINEVQKFFKKTAEAEKNYEQENLIVLQIH
jgi:hypothetical protein